MISTYIAKYILWVLLALPVLGLAVFIFYNTSSSFIEMADKRKAASDKKKAKEKRRLDFEEEYRRTHGGGGY